MHTFEPEFLLKQIKMTADICHVNILCQNLWHIYLRLLWVWWQIYLTYSYFYNFMTLIVISTTNDAIIAIVDQF